MAAFDPLAATGLLWHGDPKTEMHGAVAFAGSCFAFRSPGHVLTAAHCLGGMPAEYLGIQFGDHMLSGINDVIVHPTADAAILRFPTTVFEGLEAFWGSVGNYSLGEDFFAYGFPETVQHDLNRAPTARLFKGSFQRFWTYERRTPMRWHEGELQRGGSYRYAAGKMSIPAPSGLSGSPLFRPGAHPMVTGLVASNFTSTSAADDEGERPTLTASGVAVMLRIRSRTGSTSTCLSDSDRSDQHRPIATPSGVKSGVKLVQCLSSTQRVQRCGPAPTRLGLRSAATPSNPQVAGSNPAGGVPFSLLAPLFWFAAC